MLNSVRTSSPLPSPVRPTQEAVAGAAPDSLQAPSSLLSGVLGAEHPVAQAVGVRAVLGARAAVGGWEGRFGSCFWPAGQRMSGDRHPHSAAAQLRHCCACLRLVSAYMSPYAAVSLHSLSGWGDTSVQPTAFSAPAHSFASLPGGCAGGGQRQRGGKARTAGARAPCQG